MADLPRPDVSVDVAPSPDGTRQGASVTITRDGKSRGYVGEGATVNEAVKGVVEKIIGDRKSAEWLP